MDIPQVKTATLDDKDKCLATLTMAFAQDPIARWMFPQAHDYLKNFANMAMMLAGAAFENGGAFYVEDFSGAAMWLPPGVDADESAGEAFIANADLSEEMLGNLMKLMEEIDKYHPHDFPIWYLGMLGTDVTMQSKGRGALMMKEVLPRCDADGVVAYLESSNPQNVPFYERHGFEVMGEIWVGQPQAFTPMIREPR